MSGVSILVVDDEPEILHLVGRNLTAAGFQVITAENGAEALETVRRARPAMVILDVMMPGLTGFEVCRAMKSDSATAHIPIAMLTAKGSEVDRVVAFELGVDDFITKPFSPRELVLRVTAILRGVHAQIREDQPMQAGQIVLNRDRHLTTVRGEPTELTAVEFKLLAALLEAKGRVQTREVLVNRVWGQESEIDARTVDTHLRRLREKLGDAGEQIHTVRGFGYRLDDE